MISDEELLKSINPQKMNEDEKIFKPNVPLIVKKRDDQKQYYIKSDKVNVPLFSQKSNS